MGETIIIKMLTELSEDHKEMAITARRLFEEQKEHESQATDAKDRGKALTAPLLESAKCDRVVFPDGYYLTKQESVRVTYSEAAISQALLSAGLNADKVREVLSAAGKPTPVVSIFGRASKGE